MEVPPEQLYVAFMHAEEAQAKVEQWCRRQMRHWCPEEEIHDQRLKGTRIWQDN